MTIARIDHVVEGLDLLIETFKGLPRLEALLTSYLEPGNELEGVFFDILLLRTVDNAVGVQLDILGKLVDQPRVGTTDDIYRIFILTKIRANRSKGKNVDLGGILRLATGGTDFTLTDLYPASFVADVLAVMDPALLAVIAKIVNIARGAGIGSSLQFSIASPDDSFTYSSTSVAEVDARKGWGKSDGSSGGYWVGTI